MSDLSNKLFSVWEGVYQSFKEAGGDYDAFDTDIWIDKQKEKIQSSLKALEDPRIASHTNTSKDYPLPLIVSVLLAQQKNLSILDFGGGMGAQYLELISKVPKAKDDVTYYIVDGKKTLENIPADMKCFSNLSFHESLEDITQKVDILHIGSTLQYIENWKSLLNFLTEKFEAMYFVFSDLLAGDVPTFVSHQIFYDKKIPHIILNLEEFIDFFNKNLSFQLFYKTKYIHNILGQEGIFPNHGLPEHNRIDRAINAVFIKK